MTSSCMGHINCTLPSLRLVAIFNTSDLFFFTTRTPPYRHNLTVSLVCLRSNQQSKISSWNSTLAAAWMSFRKRVLLVSFHLKHCVLVPQMKTGPFAEHSNQLWNISAVPSWSKVNQGLIRMYKAEVCFASFCLTLTDESIPGDKHYKPVSKEF